MDFDFDAEGYGLGDFKSSATERAFLGIFSFMMAWEAFANKHRPMQHKYSKEIEASRMLIAWEDMVEGAWPLIKERVIEELRNFKEIKAQAEGLEFNAERARQWAKQEANAWVSRYSTWQAGLMAENFSGERMREAQSELGLDLYQWATMGDERVREDHAIMDGLICLRDDQTMIMEGDRPAMRPADAVQLHPKEDYNCRCTAIPVVLSSFNEEA